MSNPTSNPNSSTSSSSNPLSNIFKTPGVRNIEAAYSRAGGGTNHLPGQASKLGSADSPDGKVEKHQGVSSERFRDRVEDQKVEPGVVGKMWNNMTTGSERGK